MICKIFNWIKESSIFIVGVLIVSTLLLCLMFVRMYCILYLLWHRFRDLWVWVFVTRKYKAVSLHRHHNNRRPAHRLTNIFGFFFVLFCSFATLAWLLTSFISYLKILLSEVSVFSLFFVECSLQVFVLFSAFSSYLFINFELEFCSIKFIKSVLLY